MTDFHVATDFSPYLGGRYRSDGDFSGEEFRETYLNALIPAAIQSRTPIVIDFDGVAGMPTSFLEEAFGGFVRAHPGIGLDAIANYVRIDAPRSPRLKPFVELAVQFLKRAGQKRYA